MIQKHEFDRWIGDHGEIDDKLCKCGQQREHASHSCDDGSPIFDTDTVFDRMDARGDVRPK